MIAPLSTLEAVCVDALREHLTSESERTRHAAYELARRSVEEHMGLVDLAAMILRALRTVIVEQGGLAPTPALIERFESFALECFSPFEMEHRGAREASRALRRINERSEENARRIAYELHDSAGQLLVAVHLALDAAVRELGPGARRSLDPVRGRLEEVELELRRLSHELRPTLLDHLGLLPALRELAKGASKRSGIDVRVEDDPVGRLPSPVETALYRVVQEAITNAVKHSRARHVDVRVVRRPGGVRCTVADDGVGFASGRLSAAAGSAGLGLAGMAERLAPLSGVLRIDTAPGKGVKLDIRIPLEEPDGDPHPAG